MRSLADLLTTPGGVAFLEERGIFVDRAAFVSRLGPPARTDLPDMLGVGPRSRLVYVGQQVCADFAPATWTKFELARDISDGTGIVAAVLWHDMYQGDADRFGTRIVPPGAKARGIWLVPRNLGSHEPRLVPVDRARLDDAFAQLAAWIDQAACGDRAAARARLAALAEEVRGRDPATLAEATGAIAACLVRATFGYDPPTASASRMAQAGLFAASLNEVLAQLDEVKAVLNAAIAELLAREINPQVRPLPENYLPLHYSDPLDGTRHRLSHERSGPDHWAVATGRDGTIHRFHLGSGRASLGELEATGRWSPDVSMPIYHNDLASGWIAGRSTALYGLIFNEVLRKVLGRRPIPALVPAELGAEKPSGSWTLLFDYLTDGPARQRVAA